VLSHKAFEKKIIRDGLLDEARLDTVKRQAAEKQMPLLEALTAFGQVAPPAVYAALADFCEMRFVQPSKLGLSREFAETVPARFATHYRFVPIEKRNGTMIVAVCDPLDSHLLDDIRQVLQQKIEPVVATPEEIERSIKELYGVGADTVERILHREESEGEFRLNEAPASSDLGDETIDASIIKFVNELILEAVKSDTTDIHIEPYEEKLRVRYRIDGILHEAPTPPSIRSFHSAIVSRIKIMANLNIAEKRLPQDGKILASFGDSRYDLRVSVLPTPHGESTNIRILSRSSMYLTLEQLGFHERDLKQFNSFISRPHGIILVTGPTGSGKTTTLYAVLGKLNKIDRKIITIEDPIEYQMAGITQMQVQPRIGFDFSMGLRSMLRHDPDVMLVGEIRDYETAEMAIRSSLTGHLVLSTLHTNDAPGAVTRLIDMGVEPFLISSTMIASIAQRLVRKICTHCATPIEPDAVAIKEEFGLDAPPADATFRAGKGCDFCRTTGYKGRVAVYEIMPFSNAVKDLTVHRANALEIKRRALQEGMRTLRGSGWQRICQGQTTIEEVLRVTADADFSVDA
jgi:type II secretion system protein E